MAQQQRWMAVAWPAFLLAGVLEILVFALVDPGEMHWHGQPLAWSSDAVYSVSFFVFWLITAVACALTALLLQRSADVNA